MSGLVLEIAEKVEGAGGRALLVGGFVRDRLLGFPSKDLDVEVYGLELSKLKDLLAELGRVDEIGESFAVLKVDGIDISIPRKELKTAPGHKGFAVEGSPDLSFEEASRRRDFTVNAMAWDPLTDEILDAHGGRQDLEQKILRAVDEQTFIEDPLRVLRAMQLSARFEFEIEEKTQELCQRLDLSELSSERIGEEWKKLLLKAKKPSIGLEHARKLQIIEKLHPELVPLFDTLQDQKWHPEGTVWEHTKLAVDKAVDLIKDENLTENDRLVVLLAVLCHDLGKPEKTKVIEGRIRSRGHAEAGVKPAESFMNTLHISKSLQSRVVPLIREHVINTQIRKGEFDDKLIRKLSVKVAPAKLTELVILMRADMMARKEASNSLPEAVQLLERAYELGVAEASPERLVTGRDLLELGYEEGPELGQVLDQLYEAQLEGKFETNEEGLKYLKKAHGSK